MKNFNTKKQTIQTNVAGLREATISGINSINDGFKEIIDNMVSTGMKKISSELDIVINQKDDKNSYMLFHSNGLFKEEINSIESLRDIMSFGQTKKYDPTNVGNNHYGTGEKTASAAMANNSFVIASNGESSFFIQREHFKGEEYSSYEVFWNTKELGQDDVLLEFLDSLDNESRNYVASVNKNGGYLLIMRNQEDKITLFSNKSEKGEQKNHKLEELKRFISARYSYGIMTERYSISLKTYLNTIELCDEYLDADFPKVDKFAEDKIGLHFIKSENNTVIGNAIYGEASDNESYWGRDASFEKSVILVYKKSGIVESISSSVLNNALLEDNKLKVVEKKKVNFNSQEKRNKRILISLDVANVFKNANKKDIFTTGNEGKFLSSVLISVSRFGLALKNEVGLNFFDSQGKIKTGIDSYVHNIVNKIIAEVSNENTSSNSIIEKNYIDVLGKARSIDQVSGNNIIEIKTSKNFNKNLEDGLAQLDSAYNSEQNGKKKNLILVMSSELKTNTKDKENKINSIQFCERKCSFKIVFGCSFFKNMNESKINEIISSLLNNENGLMLTENEEIFLQKTENIVKIKQFFGFSK